MEVFLKIGDPTSPTVVIDHTPADWEWLATTYPGRKPVPFLYQGELNDLCYGADEALAKWMSENDANNFAEGVDVVLAYGEKEITIQSKDGKWVF